MVMYAVVEVGGAQWKVEPGTRLLINRLETAPGKEFTIEQVLFANDGKQPQVGRPYIDGAKVVCEVIEHRLGDKTIAYHYRRRENWRKTVGHRQRLTRLVVKSISCNGVTVGEEHAPKRASSAPARSHQPAHAAPKAAQHKPRMSALKPQIKSLAKKPVTRSKREG